MESLAWKCMAAALTVRHRDEQLVALGQRRPGPRVVEVEVEVVLRPRRARVVPSLALAMPAAAAAPSSQRRSAPQRCDMSGEANYFREFLEFLVAQRCGNSE